VGEASELRSAFQLVEREGPDVVLMDLALPGASAIPATRDIVTRQPGTQVLLITATAAPTARELLGAVGSGARAVVSRSEPAQAICAAIRAVAAGEHRFPPGLESFASRADDASAADVLGVLSPRERQIVGLIVDGMSSRDVGRELSISLKTVETHRAHINKKLGCKSPAALNRFAARNGLLGEVPSASPAAPQVQAA